MTKKELIAAVAEKVGLSQPKAAATLEEIINQLIASDKTLIKGLGIFEWKTRPARTGRNPKTGAAIVIPETTTLRFKPSSGLKNL